MRWTAGVVLVSLLLAPAVARADDDKRAVDLFKEGRAAFEAKDYARACSRFEQSLRLEPAVGTELNLGLCEEEIGRLVSSLGHLRSVLGRLAPTDQRTLITREAIRSIEVRVPKLVIVLAANAAPGSTVTRDGDEVEAAALGKPAFVDVGAHAVVLTAPGRPEMRVELVLKEGETRRLEVGAPPASAPPAPAAPRGLGTRGKAGLVSGGIGIAALGVTIATGIVVLHERSIVQGNCTGTACASQAGIDASNAGRAFAAASTVAFGVAVAGIGLGVGLLISDRGKPAPNGATVGGTF